MLVVGNPSQYLLLGCPYGFEHQKFAIRLFSQYVGVNPTSGLTRSTLASGALSN